MKKHDAEKAPYTKPELTTHGAVDVITLQVATPGSTQSGLQRTS